MYIQPIFGINRNICSIDSFLLITFFLRLLNSHFKEVPEKSEKVCGANIIFLGERMNRAKLME